MERYFSVSALKLLGRRVLLALVFVILVKLAVA